MKARRMLDYVSFLLVLIGGSAVASPADSLAQKSARESVSLHPFGYLQQLDVSWHAAFPFLMQAKGQPAFYQGALHYAAGSGSLVPALAPEGFQEVGFSSQSRQQLGAWSFQGDFGYTRELETLRPFLLQGPAQPGNPFLLAQESSSPWMGDRVGVGVSGHSAPYAKGRMSSFFRLRYQVSTAAMDAEPRPLYRANRYDLHVGQDLHVQKGFSLGLAGSFSRGIEENQIGAFAAQEFRLRFMRGLETFTRTAFQSFTRNQFQEEWALQLHARQQWGEEGFVFLVLGRAQNTFQLRDGIAFPVDAGSGRQESYQLHGGLQRTFSTGIYQQELRATRQKGNGLDPVFQAVNFLHAQRQVAGRHLWSHQRQTALFRFDWQWSVQEQEDIAAAALRRFSVTTWEAEARFSLLQLGRSCFLAGPRLGLSLPGSTQFPDPTSAVGRFLQQPDLLFYGQHHVTGGWSMTWLWQNPKKDAFSLDLALAHRQQPEHAFTQYRIQLNYLLY
ncbi:MAG: DUF6850 family outer membrane beta-barrel protein [Nitritalea sp.]